MIFCTLKGRLEIEPSERCRPSSGLKFGPSLRGRSVGIRYNGSLLRLERVYITQGSISADPLLQVPATQSWRNLKGCKSFCHPWRRGIKFANRGWNISRHVCNSTQIFFSFVSMQQSEQKCHVLVFFTQKSVKKRLGSWPCLWPLHTRDKLRLPAKSNAINQSGEGQRLSCVSLWAR